MSLLLGTPFWLFKGKSKENSPSFEGGRFKTLSIGGGQIETNRSTKSIASPTNSAMPLEPRMRMEFHASRRLRFVCSKSNAKFRTRVLGFCFFGSEQSYVFRGNVTLGHLNGA